MAGLHQARARSVGEIARLHIAKRLEGGSRHCGQPNCEDCWDKALALYYQLIEPLLRAYPELWVLLSDEEQDIIQDVQLEIHYRKE